MKRFIDAQLVKWKQSDRKKPLLISGARQVGKTWSVTHFGEKYFDSVILVDLERNPDWHNVFNKNLQAKQICTELEILTAKKIIPGKTLLFFDEIQSCSRAITALRYFYEEMPQLHVIAAGSLLEFAMQDISFPVGRIQFIRQLPLCFAEFLQATGNEEAAHLILSKPENLGETIHSFLCDQLKLYFFIGGMPESVKAFTEGGSIQESFKVQAEICDTFRMDFTKYKPQSNKFCLNTVLTTVSQYGGKQIKYSRLAESYSNPTLKKAFDLLCLAGIINKVPSVNPSGLPVGATASEKKFKALMLDIGLMRYLSGMPTDIEYKKTNLLTIFQGAMAEQFAGQEMRISQNNELYYWSRRKKSRSAEVDFISVHNGKIYPVEIKTGSSGRLKSMHMFLKKNTDSPFGIVLSARPYAVLEGQGLIFIPLYYALSATGGIFEPF
ncbi:MAG: ATP-binding protein [Desulfobacteraceae bacterium]|nr:ATP-binding protein [Desulfobacteraceae bacterium]